MWKSLAILFLVLSVLGSAEKPLPVKGDQQQQQSQPHAAAAQPATPPTCTSEVCKENAENAERYAYYKAHHKEYLKAAIAPANLSNWILGALGVIGGILALLTLRTFKRQTDHIITSERAWLLPDGEKIGMPFLRPVEHQGPQKTPVHCGIALKNCGKTPASAIDWQFELQLGDSAEAPPSFDIYKRKPPKDRLTPFPIGQDSHGNVSAVLMPQEHISASEMTDIWDGKKVLWLCGIARYHDVFKQKRWIRRKPEEHYTFVCLRYICAPNGANGQWILGGPSGYNKAI
jgi:hypothetical protein